MKRSIKYTVLAAMVAVMASPMFATTMSSTNNNNITATVVGSCQWTTPLTMPFGNYDPFAGAALTQTANVAFKCVKKTNATDSYKVWFSKTAGNMTNGTDNLAYTLTDNANAALPTTAATATAVAGTAGVGAAAGYTFTVKGSVPAGQDVTLGSYQDTVVANVEN